MKITNQLRKRLFSGVNWFLAALLTLLGFDSCDKTGTEEYGVPSADYTVKGKAVSKSTGKPVKGIRIGYSPAMISIPEYGVFPASYRIMSAADTTDVQGEFKFTEQTSPSNEAVPVYVEDIDGTENGLYAPETLTVDFKNAERTGKSKGWYEGEYTVTVLVELEELTSE
ncbi:MAG: radical SAM-associated putative lipoprotein [Tannerella sp.]|jgi:putative lipoprotein (rSAM/lipoprotein system)|nr:radical SAM-associated putative lipoprotein [Tannerella sp.]